MKKTYFLLLALLLAAFGVQAQTVLSEGFEGSQVPPTGWSMVYASPGHPANNDMTLSTENAHGGSQAFRFSSYSSDNVYDEYLITPALSLTGAATLNFYYGNFNYGTECFSVGYSTTDNDVTSFIWDEVQYVSSSSGWLLWESTVPANATYVAIHYSSNYAYYFYIDDFSLFYNSCPKPTGLTLVSVDSSSASFSWTAGGVESSWVVSLVAGNDTISELVNSTSYSVTDLAANSSYAFIVAADCGGETSAEVTLNFRTECGTTVLPLTEDFEGNGESVPFCWTTFEDWSYTSYGYTSYGVNVYNSSYDAHSGVHSLSLYNNHGNVSVASPLMPIPASEVEVSFYAQCYYDYQLQVGYVTSLQPGSSFHQVSAISFPENYTKFEVSFANVEEEDPIYVVFRMQEDEENWSSAYIDDIVIRQASSCSTPTGFAVSEVGSETITFIWNQGENSAWDLAYGAHGCNPDSAMLVESINDTLFALTDLSNDSIYDFYLRSNCGYEVSYWTDPITAQPNVKTMLFQGSDTITGCGFKVADDGGLLDSYSGSCDAVLVIYPSDSDSTIRLTGSYSTESNYDKIYIYEGVGTTGLSLGVYSGIGEVDTVSTVGPITIRFTSDGSGNYQGFEFQVVCEEKSSCVAPFGMAVSNIGAASGLVSWNYSNEVEAPDHYGIEVSDGTTTIYGVSDVTSYQIIGLTPNTTYTVNVRAVCSESDSSEAISTTFSTKALPCSAPDTTMSMMDSIWNGTNTSSAIPVQSFYNYSMSQQIYHVEEMNDMGRITGLKFQTAEGGRIRNIKVYLAHTELSSLRNFVSPEDMTEVWSGLVGYVADSVYTLNFTTPFAFNGSDNLLLTFVDYTGTWESGNYAYVHANSEYNSYYFGSDYEMPDPYDPPTTGYTTNDRLNVIWLGNPCGEHSSCVAPVVSVNDVNQNSAILSWVPGATETSWKVESRLFGADTWTVEVASTTTPNYTFTGLLANTTYQFRISSLCSDSENPSVTVKVTTPCDPITDFPFVEDFDNGFIGTSSFGSPFESCWNRICQDDYTAYPYVNTSYVFNGSSSLYFYSQDAAHPSVAVLPFMGPSVDSLQITLALMKTGSYNLKVGVMNDPNDFSTFTLVATLAPSSNNVWEQFDVSFANYTGTGKYIALVSADSYNYMNVDAVTVDYIAACPRIEGIVLDSATATTAMLHWNSTNASSYEVQYGPRGFELGTGTTVTAGDTMVTLTGLTPGMYYDVYVRGNCDNDFGNWSFVTSFASGCAEITSLPYVEDFQSWLGNETPLCWTKPGSASSYPKVNDYYDRYTSGGNCLAFSTNDAAERQVVSLPALSENFSANQLQVVLSVNSWYEGGVIVGVCTVPGDITTFTALDTAYCHEDDEWYDYTLPLDGYTGTGRYVTLVGYSSGTWGGTVEMDELSLERIPTCFRPDSLTASNPTATTIDLAWNDPNGATKWQVEYGVYDPSTQQINTSTIQHAIANSNPFTLTGLAAGTVYSYKVRAICSSTDTGDYSRTTYVFSTTQVPATLPYSYNFENANEWSNWQTNSSFADLNWIRGNADAGEGSYAMYISADNGATVSTHAPVNDYATYTTTYPNMTAYRDFDFGATDTNVTMSFMAKCGGSLNGNYDGLAIFLADPSAIVEAGSYALETPWGPLDNLDLVSLVRCDTTWQTYEVEFERVHGIQRVVFFYFNQAIGFDFIGGPAEVDNIQLEVASCPRPVAVEMTNPTSSAMTLTWIGDPSANYEVVYRPYPSDEANLSAIATTNSITLTGLAANTQYAVWVRKICGEGDTSIFTDGNLFRSGCYPGAISTFPWIEDFEAGVFCWQQEQLVGNGVWESASEYYSSETLPYSGNSIAYASHNERDEQTMLISPMLNITEGAYMTFAHIQKVWAGDQDTLGVYYRISDTSQWNYLASYTQDIQTWQVDSIALPEASSTYQIGFLFDDQYGYGVGIDYVYVYSEGCAAPVITSTAVTYNSFTATWNGTSDNYEISYKSIEDADYSTPVAVSTNSYTLTGLVPATQYVFRVRQLCDDEMISDWTVENFVTDTLDCFVPESLHQTAVSYTTVTLDWTNGGNEQHWVVKVFNSRIGEILDTVSAHPATITGLTANEQYFATVQAACGSTLDGFSDWSDTISFTTSECVAVSNISCAEPTDSYVQISWTSNGSESTWIVEYGMPGFGQGEELGRVAATTNPYQLSLAGLDPETEYEVYVYAQCMEGLTSVPAGPASFTTRSIGISGVEGNADINIYPNPTSGNATISVSGISGEVTIDIVDMNGRTISSTTQQISDTTKVNVEGLAQGAYFVRIYGEEISTIRKLIVR